MSFILVILGTFLISECVGWFVHFFAHKKYSGPLYRAHMFHHKTYVPERYETEKYIVSFWDSFTPWMAPAFIFLGVIAYSVLPLSLFITFFLTLAINAFISDTVHERFHLNRNIKNSLFARKKILHRIHHKNTKKNLGINTHLFDKLFGTWKNID